MPAGTNENKQTTSSTSEFAPPIRGTSTVGRAFFAQRLILGLALLVVGGVLTFNLLQERSRIEQISRGRLSLGAQSLAKQVEHRLRSIDRALLDLRSNLQVITDHHDGLAHLTLHLKT